MCGWVGLFSGLVGGFVLLEGGGERGHLDTAINLTKSLFLGSVNARILGVRWFFSFIYEVKGVKNSS